MREVFHERFGQVGRDLSTMADLSAAALRGASVALLEADMMRAHEVIRGEEAMGRLREDLESCVVDLCAGPRPVPDDVRLLVAALRMGTDLERMAELTVQLAKIADGRHPAHAIPAGLATVIARMAAAAAELADGASHIIKGQDLETAHTLELSDDVVDRLHRDLLRALLDPAAAYATQTAMDITLAGRCYGRFADHAVSIARRLEFAAADASPAVASD